VGKNLVEKAISEAVPYMQECIHGVTVSNEVKVQNFDTYVSERLMV
jgi:hypothetical protein